MDAWFDDFSIIAMINVILASGADVNMTNNSGETPLHQLVTSIIPESECRFDMLSVFLSYRPDVTSPMRSGLSSLTEFFQRSDILSRDQSWAGDFVETRYRCLEQFLNAGADPNTKFCSKPLLDYCLEKGSIREQGPSGKFI